MNKKLTGLILAGALACAMTLPAMATETRITPISTPISADKSASLPDSVLYYGTAQKIVKDANGNITQLHMTSERYGEYVMNITAQTVWIDSGRRMASDPSTLQEGESLYVFHSAVETRSLPPQSAAFAVVRNIPMDADCAHYHQVEAVFSENGQLKITTDSGRLYILTGENTTLSCYGSDEAAAQEDIQPGIYVMVWYEGYAAVYPDQTYAAHLMLLPGEVQPQEGSLTRGQLAVMLYEQAGKPSTDFVMDYTDVAGDAMYTEAVRWAASEGYMSGYGNGAFGPEDVVSREQLATILWRYAGSPMLMDYPALTQFADVGEISRFAQPAFTWAHQKGLISAEKDGLLHPQADMSAELAEAILNEFSSQK
ncbi:MAG: S-layer homology domain-containing protein [Clostridiales bacterium]|uniref:S-layer homology domain-containing protein n=1 Tax=Flavonifractor porci TaxID=3133422 RepID=UPI00309E162C|nr:S-layer homology domain-containing protein [Clostridiales bacterium]